MQLPKSGPMLKKCKLILLFIWTFLCFAQCNAQLRTLEDILGIDKNQESRAGKVEFPKSPPQEKDLFPFSPSANTKTLEFFIDQKNISFTQDIVHYVVVIKSNEGAQQTLFVGLDCRHFLKHTYARLENNIWQDVNDPDWKPVGNLGYNNYQAYLGRKGLCAGDSANSSVKDILLRLQDKRVDYAI
jgi:hypothetical protein